MAVGEDSGLAIDALGGEPGIRSARWLGDDTPYDIKNARTCSKNLRDVVEDDRSARYVSAVALAADDEIAFTAEGICEGRIATEPSRRWLASATIRFSSTRRLERRWPSCPPSRKTRLATAAKRWRSSERFSPRVDVRPKSFYNDKFPRGVAQFG